jgi:hypothetical protein
VLKGFGFLGSLGKVTSIAVYRKKSKDIEVDLWMFKLDAPKP